MVKLQDETKENKYESDDDDDDDFNYVDNEYPNPYFTICISKNELDEVLTNETYIVLKNTYNCYCYSNCIREPDYFYISHPKITYRVIIEHLIKNNFDPACNHNFFEGIVKTKNSTCQYDIFMGS
jgi:hypothetical protein